MQAFGLTVEKFFTFTERFSALPASTFGKFKYFFAAANKKNFFSALYTTKLSISDKEETVAVGVSPEAMERIIRFAYLREVHTINETNVWETLITADYFAVLGLLKHCIKFVIAMLSPANCITFWLMSR